MTGTYHTSLVIFVPEDLKSHKIWDNFSFKEGEEGWLLELEANSTEQALKNIELLTSIFTLLSTKKDLQKVQLNPELRIVICSETHLDLEIDLSILKKVIKNNIKLSTKFIPIVPQNVITVVDLILKDGTEINSSIKEWKPKKGYLTLANNSSIELNDIAQGTFEEFKFQLVELDSLDLLELASEEGWISDSDLDEDEGSENNKLN